jgi:Na+-driven multidrug efflux pump
VSAWTGATTVALLCGMIGLIIAFQPSLWIGLFSDDPEVARLGTLYLRIVGPAYISFGLGLGLFYVSQGVGRGVAAMNANAVRMIASAGAGSSRSTGSVLASSDSSSRSRLASVSTRCSSSLR